MPLTKEEVASKIALAELYRKSDYQKSRDYALEVLEYARESGDRLAQGRALMLIGLADFHLHGGYVEEPFLEAIAIYESIEQWNELSHSLTYLAHSVGRRGDFEQAEQLLDRATTIAFSHGNVEAEAAALVQVGYLSIRRRHLTKALAALHRAVVLFDSIGKDASLALQALGTVHRALKQYDQALDYYQRSLKVLDVTDVQAHVTGLGNIGLVLEEMGRQEEAKEYLYRALEIAEKAGDLRNLFQITSALPRVHLHFNEQEKALEAIDKLIAWSGEGLEKIFRCAAISTRADYHRHRKEWHEAIEDLSAALAIADEVQNLDQIRIIHQELAECYKNIGEFQQALEHHEIFCTIQYDSMSSQLNERINELEARHKHEQIIQQNEIFRLKNIDLIEANIALDVLNRQKDKFLSILQHDMRNPIASIIGYSDLLMSGEEGISAQEVARIIEQSGRRLLTIVQGVMESARTGTLAIEPIDSGIGKLLHDVSAIVRPLAEGKDLLMQLEDHTGGAMFHIDVSKIYQVLTNLMFNSVKFTPSGKGISLVARVEDKGTLLLAIEDEGIGIPKAFLPRLFAGTKETQRKGTSGEDGTGMGLSIVKTIIELHGGSVVVESEEGYGTKVAITIPPESARELTA